MQKGRYVRDGVIKVPKVNKRIIGMRKRKPRVSQSAEAISVLVEKGWGFPNSVLYGRKRSKGSEKGRGPAILVYRLIALSA